MQSEVFHHFDPSASSGENGGPLYGRRAAVQSGICVRGWPTEAGSRALKGFKAIEDASVVERMRRAGAALVGNTRTSELGFGLYGDCSGKALAEGLADIVLMTDTLGEARVAAALAGLCGFKPSWGRISRFGLIGLVPSMESCGMMAGNPGDIRVGFEAIEGIDDRDPSMPGSNVPPRVNESGTPALPPSAGIVTQCLETLDSVERVAFSRGLSRLRLLGIPVREVKFEDFDLFRTIYQVIGSVEASSSCGKYDGVRFGHRASGGGNWNEMYLRSRSESFSPLLKTFLFQGAWFQFENYEAFEKACRIRARLADESRKLFSGVDVLVFPARRAANHAASAQTLDRIYDAFSLTLLSNVTGQPSISLPGFVTAGEEDLGLQIVGPLFGDERILSISEWLFRKGEEAR